ncbi:MAG: hypothetical protein LBJ64_01210 [Deltaproteobacteria bacterium]|jgi:hypothetical protein|nr:hypothetical protein [Deltaproteobacteria bacterium]
MTDKKNVDLEALIQRGDPVTAAIRQGGLEAMKRCIQAGVPMVGHKNGQVIRIPPEELAEMLKAAEAEA